MEHKPRHFATLDGMRGVAAIAVAFMHAPELTSPLFAHSAFLAVDLFFMLSGFVIVHAYDPRFAAGMSLGEFFRLRIIRLYPLFAVGVALGIAITAGGLLLLGRTNNWTWGEILWSAPFSLAMLPTPGAEYLYPPNPVGWSLFFEILINLAYAVFWRPLRETRVLVACIVVSGLAVLGLTIYGGRAEMGGSWSTAFGGAARASFGFLTGVLLHRIFQSGWRLGPVSPWIALAVGLAVYALPRGPWSLATDLASIFLVFPLLVLAGAQSEPGPRWVGLFSFLGVTSYAVYAINKPLAVAAFAVIEKVAHIPLKSVSPWSGLVYMAGVLLLAWLLDRYFDGPTRKALSRMTARPAELKAA
jgi:peptidoglycan/LPS O-acetylase OafA/YrhL